MAAVNRAEPLMHDFLTRLTAIGERDHDEVALVALHVLQVFHEERFSESLTLFEIGFDTQVSGRKAFEFATDQLALLGIDRDDADRAKLFGVVDEPLHQSDGLLDNALCLGWILVRLVCALDLYEVDRERARLRHRERDQ